MLSFIASKVQSNIRELEGALIRVTAFSSLNGSPVDLALAEIVLKDLFPDEGRHEVSVPIIMAETASYFGLTIEEEAGNGRTDVAVAIGERRIAVEVLVDKVGNEGHNLLKVVSSGRYDELVMVAPYRETLGKLQREIRQMIERTEIEHRTQVTTKVLSDYLPERLS